MALAGLVAAITAALAVYAFAPVPVVRFLDSSGPVRIGSSEVHPGDTLRWIRTGTTCFPDAEILMRWSVETSLPNGSPFAFPGIGPRFNRLGACATNNPVDFELPRNIPPGEFRVRFDFCSAAGQLLRETCVTAYSPSYVLTPKGP